MYRFCKVSIILAALVASLDQSLAQEPRIIGGNYAYAGQFPFMVSLQANNSRHFCGGTIINSYWILSAAHCFLTPPQIPISQVSAVTGTTELSNPGPRYNISKLFTHPGYNSLFILNDVALLKTSTAIQFNNFTQPIMLNPSGIPGGLNVTTVGWGVTQLGSRNVSNELKFINFKTMDQLQCQISLILNGKPNLAFPSYLCVEPTFSRNGTKEMIYLGDSGGPLIYQNTQIGITSATYVNGTAPMIFTRVSPYINWIYSIMYSN